MAGSSTKDDVLASLIDREKPVRFSCSDIAALAGYHPYSQITELFEKYLYQDLDLLRQIDCKRLNIEIVSVDEEIGGILSKLGDEHQRGFQEIQSLLSSEQTLSNHAHAQLLIQNISSLVKSEHVKQKLSKEEIELLGNELDGRVKKQYGIFSEESALDRYEAITGYSVVERNESTHYLDFAPMVVDLTGVTAVTEDASSEEKLVNSGTATEDSVCIPPHVLVKKDMIDVTSILMASSRRRAESSTTSLKRKNDSSSAVTNSTTAVSLTNDTNDNIAKKRKVRPAFTLIGKIDGMSHQLDVSSDDASKWKPTRVVVEVKSRVYQVKDPPPLYEQIQLVAYMVMLNCKYGDLVQAVRVAAPDPIVHSSATPETTASAEVVADNAIQIAKEVDTITSTSKVFPTVTDKEFKISRVTLNAPPYYHQFHWDTVIIPRLHVFRDAIMAIRKNDDMRASFLLSEEDVRLAFIQQLCPYLTE